MKAFVLAVAAMAVIGVGTHFILGSMDYSAQSTYQSNHVRQ